MKYESIYILKQIITFTTFNLGIKPLRDLIEFTTVDTAFLILEGNKLFIATSNLIAFQFLLTGQTIFSFAFWARVLIWEMRNELKYIVAIQGGT